MARPVRICIPGAVYHVIARGNARELVYRDDVDRSAFIELLGRVVDRFGWHCHAYCLMDNHYHLVVETPQPNLPTGMRQLNGLYAQRFNRRHGRCGHVFQARYRAVLIEKESHLLAVCRYVVLNPVRAGICRDPGDYAWTSFRATAGERKPPPFLSTEWILGQFASTRSLGQARYRSFVLGELDENLEARVRGERLGEEPFLRDRFGYALSLAEIPRVQIEPVRRSLEAIFASASHPVATAYRGHGYRLREIAEHLGCHYSTVSRRLEREEALLALQDLTP